jgi:hypothetical protein
MNFVFGIFGIFFRSISWALSRIIIAIIQQWIIVVTLLLIDKGSFRAKKAWAVSKGSPANLRALMKREAQKRAAIRREKKLYKLQKRLRKTQESLEIITET